MSSSASKSCGPSKTAEAIVGFFVPPACREEVLGDLHERYRSSGQYALEAFATVPLVIVSRMRRVADPQVFLIQAFAQYASFLSAAWLNDRQFLNQERALVRLAVPAAMAILGMILEDTYTKPGRGSPVNPAQGPMIGLALALASQTMFRVGSPDLAIPGWIVLYGCGTGLLLSSAIRMLFPPPIDPLQSVHVPADWLKQASMPPGASGRSARSIKGFAALVFLVLLIAYQVWKRG